MADPILDLCPKCGSSVEIYPQSGGTKLSGLTCYQIECSKCDLKIGDFGQNTGRKRDAIREWNRYAKARRADSHKDDRV